jgi:PKD repeat protein
MKRIIYLFLALPLLIFSCESSPEAYFSANTNEPAVGEEVVFNNESTNAVDFEWDFGDGYISNDNSPGHIYNVPGTYEVILKAISKSGLESKATLTLTVMIPTLLEIEVREYYDDYAVPDASVILYPSLADWNAQTNKVYEGFTDSYGIVVFAGLKNIAYFVDVWEQNHDNYALKAEDVGFIQTSVILPHKINRFIAWVDYVKHTKGAAKGAREIVIKKLERKAADKRQPAADSGLQDWQELYNKRVIQK